MSIPREFIELLLAKIDLVDLINIKIPLNKKTGSNYFARCPFHQEKSASFSVSQTKQFYYCFGCGAHGNAIDFLMQYDHLSFTEAITALSRQAGMEVPRSTHAPQKNEGPILALYDLMSAVAQYYYQQLRQSQRAKDYLKNRGITGKIAQQFQLGYAPAGWSHLLDSFGKKTEDRKKLQEAGLIIHKNEGGFYDRFRDRIMFPIHDYRGRLIGFGGRIIDEGEPKYLNSPETVLFKKGQELYGLYQSLQLHRKLERIILVEGYMDVIALFQHGITYAAATLGTATTPHHLQRLCRYTSNICFCFDGDEAGRTAAWRALQVIFPLMDDRLQITFLFLPEGDDPDSLVRREGQHQFEKRLDTALSLSDFFFQHLSLQCDFHTMEGRARFAALALTHIKELPSGIFQSILLDALSKRARIDLATLQQQFKGKAAVAAVNPAVPADKSLIPAPIRLAATLLVQSPPLALLIEGPLPENRLPGAGFLYQLIDLIKQNPQITTTGLLLEYWRGKKEESNLIKLAQTEHAIPEKGVQNEFLGAIRQLLVLNIDNEINRLLAKGAQDGLSIQEKMELTAQIGKKKALLAEMTA